MDYLLMRIHDNLFRGQMVYVVKHDMNMILFKTIY